MSNDNIEIIRARHLRDDRWRNLPSMICPQAHDDRATLLAEDERHRAEIERLRKAMTNMMIGWRHIRREREEYRAEVERLREQIERMTCESNKAVVEVDKLQPENERLREAIRTSRARCVELELKNESLRVAATSAGAALAAAIELLERGREDAPSKRMFSQMLADYRVIVARTRKALEDNL